MRRELPDSLTFPVFLAIFFIFVALFTAIIAATINNLSFSAEVAQIEQLRSDVRKVSDGPASEDVLGQAVTWNQKIISNKVYDRFWWADLFIPDGWNKVEPIDIAK